MRKRRIGLFTAAVLSCLLLACVFSAALAETEVPFGKPALYSSVSNNFPTYNDSGKKHRGNDIQGAKYTAIYAVRSGKVRYAGKDSSYGNYVSIRDSEFSTIDFRYCHLDSYIVKKGDAVNAGDVIGFMGATGNVTGVHLHLEGAWKGNGTTGFSDINLNTCFKRKSSYPANAYYMAGSSPTKPTGDGAAALNYKLVYKAGKAPEGKLRATYAYPSTFKKGTSWILKGAVVSPRKLTSVDVWIENASGSRVTGMSSAKNPGDYFFDIHSIDSQVKMQKVSSAGTYYYCISAKDEGGNTLKVKQKFTASDSDTKTSIGRQQSGEDTPTTETEEPYSAIFQFTKDDELRAKPEEASTKIEDKKKGSIIFVVAKIINKYNNLWYKTDNGYYVYSGDVEQVKLSETALSGKYAFNKDDESRIWPYEASKIITKYKKGDVVSVAAEVINTYKNTWYKLTDGSYVYSGDLDKVTPTPSPKPEKTSTPSPKPTPKETVGPKVTATPTPKVTVTPKPEVTVTPIVTKTPRPEVTQTPTPTPTLEPPKPVVTHTPTPTPVVTPVPTATPTAVPTPTVTPIPTPTPTPRVTPEPEAEVWIISFDADGGSGVMEDDEVEKGKLYTLPECEFIPPSGMEFEEWDYGEPGSRIEVDSDMVITAVWKESSSEVCIISFDENGGSGFMDDVEVKKGEQFTLPDCEFDPPEDMEFDQWDLGEPGAKITVNEDLVIVALWRDEFTTEVYYGGGEYELDLDTKTATLVAPIINSVEELTIPATVKANDTSYKVTAIKASAFKNRTKLKKLTIGTNVRMIGKNAFYGCKNLKTIIIKTTKLTSSSVKDKAFKNIYKKATIKCPRAKLKEYKKLLLKKGVPSTATFTN